MTLRSTFFILSILFLFGCDNTRTTEEFVQFQLFTNYSFEGDTLRLDLNTRNAYVEGVCIPSLNESGEEEFLHYKIAFTPAKEQKTKYYYKVYYQNSSYKFPEWEDGNKGTYNLKASENFYGSWEDVGLGFRYLAELGAGENVEFVDSIRIVGNPRNEERYYSYSRRRNVGQRIIDSIKLEVTGTPEWVKAVQAKANSNSISFEEQLHLDALWTIKNGEDQAEQTQPTVNRDQLLAEYINKIREDQEWFSSVEQKAIQNKVSLDEQLRLDAVYMMNLEIPSTVKEKKNLRARRNPRMGNYSFKLVIVSEEELANLPASVVDISKTDELHQSYLNPFFYFNEHNYIADLQNSFVLDAQQSLNAKIRMSGQKGVYIDPLKLRSPNADKSYYTEKANSSDQLFKEAEFEQYFHVINRDYELKNVPILADVIGDNYTQNEFKKNMKKYPLDDRPISHTKITSSPGKTVFYNDSMEAIQILNPANESLVNASKENVGVATRIGLSYGKFTAKIRFPKMLSDSNVWNGLTCAFWLFSDAMSEWNQRDICEKDGYLAKGAKKYSTDYSPTSSYSEIDIEIVKTSKHWPKTSYGGIEDYPIDDPQNNRNLMVTTTNWDMACKDPKGIHQGLVPIEYAGKTFQPHRWDFWYQAATTKHEYPHDKTVGEDFYYQIEWKPNEIIWRIGPSKDKMDVIGYINDHYSKIPNNQMIAITTQEFHYALWWPLAPFDQNNVPYPSEDINGYVYYVEVE